jgi:DNA-binding transcriptional ArsR family regulator
MDLFHALADPTRRQILENLAKFGQLTASEISNQFPVSPQAISQHLKILREAGWVKVERRATQRIYRIDPQAAADMEDWARQLKALWEERFDALDKVLESEKHRITGGKG